MVFQMVYKIFNLLSVSESNLRNAYHQFFFSDDSLDQESIDRALAESIDTNSLRENEMMSIGSPGGAHGSISASQREDHIIS